MEHERGRLRCSLCPVSGMGRQVQAGATIAQTESHPVEVRGDFHLVLPGGQHLAPRVELERDVRPHDIGLRVRRGHRQ